MVACMWKPACGWKASLWLVCESQPCGLRVKASFWLGVKTSLSLTGLQPLKGLICARHNYLALALSNLVLIMTNINQNIFCYKNAFDKPIFCLRTCLCQTRIHFTIWWTTYFCSLTQLLVELQPNNFFKLIISPNKKLELSNYISLANQLAKLS